MLAGMSCDPSNEFDHMAQWLPLLDGIGISYEHRAPIPKGPGERTREKLADFDAIPKALHPAVDPRCPLEDHPEDLQRAVETLRKIEWLLSSDSTHHHAIVLLVAYGLLGSEARKRFDPHGGVGLWVGAVCALGPQRQEWIVKKCVGKSICLDYGNALLDAARTAWENLPRDASRPVANRGRLRFGEVFSMLTIQSRYSQDDLKHWLRGESPHVVTARKTGESP